MTQLAEKIHGYALEDLSLGGKPFNTLMERLKTEKSLSWLQCSFYPFKNKKKPCFDVIDGIPQLKESQMLVILLRASDNSMNHVVTIYKNWIFDSCENQALPLCKEGLDVCTRENAGDMSCFIGFVNGLLITLTKPCKKCTHMISIHIFNIHKSYLPILNVIE